MCTGRIFRWTAVVAILAAFAPASASAQIGGFIKKKLKEKIIQAVNEKVVPDTPVTAEPAGTQPAPATGTGPAGTGRAVKGAEPIAPASGPQFSFYVLEMTRDVLDKLEKGLAAEAAERKANERVLARMQDTVAYNNCIAEVMKSPEGQKAYNTMTNGTPEGYRQGGAEYQKLMEKCGPAPNTYGTVKANLANKPAKAGEDASGFEYRQYSILKERVSPFCTLTAPAAGGEVKIPVRSGVFLVYSPAEVQALTDRCAKLLPALKAVQ